MGPGPIPRRSIAIAALCVVALLPLACGRNDLGSGFQLTTGQLTKAPSPPTTTTSTSTSTTTTRIPVDHTVEVATAKVPTVEVYAAKPGDPSSSVAPPGPALGVQPIPRPDLVSAGSRVTPTGWQFDNPTYFNNPLVFLVTQNAGDWLRVLIHARPNQTEGWIRAADVVLSSHDYRVELSLSGSYLEAYAGEELIGASHVVIGTPGTRTPTGRFYINEKIRQGNPGGAYGPWILSTNGYSENLELFQEGLPVIALHGTNQPGLLGSASSNGCVRLPNDLVTLLATTLPAGTPVNITP